VDLFHAVVVRRAASVDVAGDLCVQVADADELFEDVLREDVGEAVLFVAGVLQQTK